MTGSNGHSIFTNDDLDPVPQRVLDARTAFYMSFSEVGCMDFRSRLQAGSLGLKLTRLQ